MTSPEEQVAAMRAEQDQANAAMREFARSVRVYYTELVEQGFTEDQALTITISWQASMMAGMRDDDE